MSSVGSESPRGSPTRSPRKSDKQVTLIKSPPACVSEDGEPLACEERRRLVWLKVANRRTEELREEEVEELCTEKTGDVKDIPFWSTAIHLAAQDGMYHPYPLCLLSVGKPPCVMEQGVYLMNGGGGTEALRTIDLHLRTHFFGEGEAVEAGHTWEGMFSVGGGFGRMRFERRHKTLYTEKDIELIQRSADLMNSTFGVESELGLLPKDAKGTPPRVLVALAGADGMPDLQAMKAVLRFTCIQDDGCMRLNRMLQGNPSDSKVKEHLRRATGVVEGESDNKIVMRAHGADREKLVVREGGDAGPPMDWRPYLAPVDPAGNLGGETEDTVRVVEVQLQGASNPLARPRKTSVSLEQSARALALHRRRDCWLVPFSVGTGVAVCGAPDLVGQMIEDQAKEVEFEGMSQDGVVVDRVLGRAALLRATPSRLNFDVLLTQTESKEGRLALLQSLTEQLPGLVVTPDRERLEFDGDLYMEIHAAIHMFTRGNCSTKATARTLALGKVVNNVTIGEIVRERGLSGLITPKRVGPTALAEKLSRGGKDIRLTRKEQADVGKALLGTAAASREADTNGYLNTLVHLYVPADSAAAGVATSAPCQAAAATTAKSASTVSRAPIR
uniref:Uncharacterized protein n=1 Tax=Chromera velia CCMP2878 TaxID=1169474 RepID=A0A0G4F7M9_9ALVE|eukprot:Cvel_2902.t1-p1 / transcript=Cvel_2902.t1 / gene=Cvel_2902 / organism=Chromera_velia_CCMP2878 / gene_product=Proline-rich receptor-like protein kinase PERK10, putative / transcript_product=Proline-rich receptor-like protein kinase PERK10, putative / location=Cvel_scaffold115:2780-6001(+) / protein_length=614 / sequence_SO=supercontig / SO=protein_coding / is_pseudo=false